MNKFSFFLLIIFSLKAFFIFFASQVSSHELSPNIINLQIDKKRIFNLGYFTWVEQQGISLEDFEKRKNQEFWNSHYNYMLSLDNKIKEFNNI